MKQPRFLENLKPVDFKAVAAQGCYVYAYLRSKDSKRGKAGTPYYIGISSTDYRPTHPHKSAPVPKNKAFIRVIKSALTWEEACSLEVALIERHGRSCDSTGVLLNLTKGGEGTLGYVHPEETRQKIKERRAAQKMPKGEEWLNKQGAALLALAHSQASRKKRDNTVLANSAKKIGICPVLWAMWPEKERRRVKRRYSLGHRTFEALTRFGSDYKAVSERMTGRVVSAETRRKMSKASTGRKQSEETCKKKSESMKATIALKSLALKS